MSAVGHRAPGNGAGRTLGFCAAWDFHDPGGYSGVPSALLEAFAELEVSVLPLPAELPGPLQRFALNVLAVGLTRPGDLPASGSATQRLRLAVRENKPRVHAGAAMAGLRSAALRGAMWRHPRPSVCVQFGSEYRLRPGLRYVTYDDATIVQLWREYDYPWMRAVPEAELLRMIARQQAIFRRADRCCVTNHWAARSAIDDYGIDPQRVIVTGEGGRRIERAGGRDWRTPRFLFVGREWERKNLPGVLRAFARVRVGRPDARLVVVGRRLAPDPSGVKSYATLPLGDPTARAELDELFSHSTCLVLPSLLEPSALVFAEALQAGLPSIGSTAGGSATIVGDAGIMVAPGDERALAAAMVRMCDSVVLARYAAAARRRAPLFTWRAVAERVLRAAAPLGLDTSGFALPL